MSVPSDPRPGPVLTAPELVAAGSPDSITEPTSPPNEHRIDPTRAVLIGAILIAIGWCAYGLDARSLWLDEAISSNATGQLGETLNRTNGTMGLYYVLLTGWTTIFGHSAVALRSLSVVFVSATVVVTFLLARRLLTRNAAYLAVILVALLPALTRYGQEARSYALTALIATASWYCLVRAVTDSASAEAGEDQESVWWTAVTLLSVLGLFSHGLFIVQVIVQGASLVAARRWDALRRFLPALVLSGATGAMLFLRGGKEVANWVPPLSVDQVVDALSLLLGPTLVTAVIAGGLVVAGVVASAARFVASGDPDERWKALIPCLWAFGPLLAITVVSAARPYLLPRYIVASLPALALLLAGGVDLVHRSVGKHFGPRATPWTASVALILAGSLVIGQVVIHSQPADDWRSAARIVAEQASVEDRVIFTQPDLKLAFDSAWNELPTDPRTAPTVVYPARPLGQLHRFDPPADPEHVSPLLVDADRLWVVHRTMNGNGDVLLDQLLDWPAVDEGFQTVDHHRLDGGVQVILLQRPQR